MPPIIRKRIVKPNLSEKMAPHGLYVHSSPPRVLPMNAGQIRLWLRSGDLEKLEQIVLEGQGHRLVGEYSPEARIRAYIRNIPTLMSKADGLHDAVSRGSLSELQELLQGENQKKKLILCKDPSGVSLLHKAVFYDYPDIVTWITNTYPSTVHLKDKEGRTPLHYCGTCRDSEAMMTTLLGAGADRAALDSRLHTAAYYLEHPGEAELPDPMKANRVMRRLQDGKDALIIKPSNIRIWIHDRDLGRLQRVLWEGHGAKLRTETSNSPRVRKFLEAVPHIMGNIRDIHSAAINNNLELMMSKTADPIPPVILSSKDVNGLTALHKAAGLGHTEIVEYLLERYPDAATAVDHDGKTPLHYAAGCKDNVRIYNLLVQAGSDQAKLDSKLKTPGYYKSRSNELDKSLLSMVPEAPRTATDNFPTSWDWGLLSTGDSAGKPIKKLEKVVDSLFGNTTEEKEEEEKQPEELVDNPAPLKKRHNETLAEKISKLSSDMPDNDNNSNGNGYDEQLEEEDPKIEEFKDETDGPLYRNGSATLAERISRIPVDETMNGNGISEPEVEEIQQEEPDPEPEENEPEPEAEEQEPMTNGYGSPELNGEENGIENGHQEEENEYEQEFAHAETAEVFDVEQDRNEFLDSLEQTATSPVMDGNEMESESVSQSPVLSHSEDDVIEGVVTGSPDDGQLQSEGMEREGDEEETDEGLMFDEQENQEENSNEQDAEVTQMVLNGDMEQLAQMVLSGDGHRLIGQHSEIPELQAFLDNVPAYMNKIRRVHVAAREGSLRDLQGALDRRKFATARDVTSPAGATPLHVATIFGHTSIVRYLGGRFPETCTAVDENGRTPLHYAATIRDNGHYYGMLLNLGGDVNIEDNLGNVAEYYRSNDEELSHKKLLRDFGAEEEFADEMLNDQDLNQSNQVEIPLFRTEEGRYLATTLGDPLVKGLTEVANKRPKDPIAFLATYLYNFANQNKSRIQTQESAVLITSGPEEVENESIPPVIEVETLDEGQIGGRSPDGPESASSSEERDEHGQSMLHFAAARSHGRNALFQLLQESGINVAYRDELYRTARDVSLQANLPDNAAEIDRFVLHLAARGDSARITELLVEGYDHILDIVDSDGVSIKDVVSQRDLPEMAQLMDSIPSFEERREQLHDAMRQGDKDAVQQMLIEAPDASLLCTAKNAFGRSALHIAVLKQHEELSEMLANQFSDTLRVGDNLERTALHYAMGVDKVESLSRILIKAGAKRVLKDLKGRQATYYFMNKSDILRLQEEEDTF